MHEHTPKAVRDAKLNGDRKALGRMGRAGAESRKINNAIIKDRRSEQEKAVLLEQEKIYHVSEDGDVLPPDEHIIADLKSDQ